MTISSKSLIDIIWWTADVSPQETLTRDFTVLSKFLLIVLYVIGFVVPVAYFDSNLALLSAPAGWPETKKRYVPIPDSVEPKPTTLALTSNGLTLSFSICNFTKLFSSIVWIY